MNVYEIAKVAHEVNRAYCNAIGDSTPLPWDEAPEWVRESAFQGVIAHQICDMTPELSHTKWCWHKESLGWKYGKVKDADKKEHPCLVPYHELPVSQQVKDHLFAAIVKELS